MRRAVRVLWIASIAAVLLPAGAAAQGGVHYLVRSDAAPCLRVHTAPASDAPTIACLQPATRVEVTGVTPYWREVRFDSTHSGWAAKRYLVLADSSATTSPQADDAWLEIHVVDVGQGDGIWIHTFDDNIPGNDRYEGRNIVIDGGPDASDDKNAFLKYLLQRAHEGARIDAMFVTHPHDDHYPGAEGILRHFEVSQYYDPGYPKAGVKWARFRTQVDSETAAGQPITEHIGRASFGSLDWGSELKVQVLYSYPGSPAGLGSGNTLENNASIVLRIQYGTQSILLMGDAEGKDRDGSPDTAKYVERILLDSVPSLLHSTVLKIAHHGSETSSTNPFIDAVDPQYVIVSSGRKPFGGRFLPDATTLQRYCDHNSAIRIYSTDEGDAADGRTARNDADGDDIVIRMNPDATVVEAYSGGTRITHTTCAP